MRQINSYIWLAWLVAANRIAAWQPSSEPGATLSFEPEQVQSLLPADLASIFAQLPQAVQARICSLATCADRLAGERATVKSKRGLSVPERFASAAFTHPRCIAPRATVLRLVCIEVQHRVHAGGCARAPADDRGRAAAAVRPAAVALPAGAGSWSRGSFFRPRHEKSSLFIKIHRKSIGFDGLRHVS